ncbi:MarR family winged helix-turn-helix transcriptional regulator [Burkholderia glumae]|uniref:MarR family transcriptional regulator n=1 Tax=Burkholderia glumae TaxID=337 RepID=A0AAQ0BS22_BURGL|nr:MarR family transcriptional regulator [Burkholderia glumae]ACR30609.1 Transcriptional regulator, MarR family [Burkholderia glumae BGR1]AJY63390.1 winged helix DNA-binding domain protein [Burkholderia glumae LMG 2196 = ATCC 33617]MCM2484100.1 MarR family transcriptional regulator [Burkholderia glumae]MCM2509790.1 MarR family transcriptional regulator [Burkholderia glumae]MCM2539553.1 MarR family transcriptional regulator [Burkholderia glumae]
MTALPMQDHVDLVVAQWRDERPELDVASMEVLGRLARLAKHCEKARTEALSPFGFKEGEFDVLATLRRAGAPYELSPTQLYRSLMITSGAVTHRLMRLEQAGLVERVPNPQDGRGMAVRLTREGLALIDKAVNVHVDTQNLLLGGLDRDDRQILAALLKRALLALPGQALLPDDAAQWR